MDIIGTVDEARERALNKYIVDQILEAVASTETLITKSTSMFSGCDGDLTQLCTETASNSFLNHLRLASL